MATETPTDETFYLWLSENPRALGSDLAHIMAKNTPELYELLRPAPTAPKPGSKGWVEEPQQAPAFTPVARPTMSFGAGTGGDDAA